ncbi:hypothetical protein GGH91_002758 [Coemansia sp. RSA 2671]|nr:hypothetical protein LPJ60_004964 [Coemansia sp. RSA 2675]KAJ2344757.1 hypothetical protein GGH91_002758 [Coemansia sp. RSA 2671]
MAQQQESSANKPTLANSRRPRARAVQTHSDDDDEIDILDARKWVERLKQKKPVTTKKPQRPARSEYTSAELTGLRVSHDINDLGGGEHVLTLQDKSIDELDDDGIELHSVALAQPKRAREPQRHDEENEKEESFFTINDTGTIDNEPAQKARPGQTVFSLEEEQGRVVSDFYTEEEAAALFRKPKKHKSAKEKSGGKRRQPKTTSTNDFEPIDTGDNAVFSRRLHVDDSSLADDDDDLQRAIAAVRRTASKAAVLTAEDIAQQVHDDMKTRMDVSDAADNPALALSSTIEFVQSLKAAAAATAATKKPDAIDSEEKEAEPAEIEVETVIVKRSAPQPAKAPVALPVEEPEAQDISREPSVGSGLFATLSLLRQRNQLDKLTDEQRQREVQQRNRDQLLSEQRRQESTLALERQRIKQLGTQPLVSDKRQRRGKADELTPRELDEMKAKEQEAMDRKWAREYEERMRDYKPEVNLEYVDETGRQLTTKEAYKQLSHAFHGHYSGKNKIDKVMAKRERERKQMEITSGTSTHQYGAVLENAHKKLGSAGIVLNSGNKPGLGPSSAQKDH